MKKEAEGRVKQVMIIFIRFNQSHTYNNHAFSAKLRESSKLQVYYSFLFVLSQYRFVDLTLQILYDNYFYRKPFIRMIFTGAVI